MEIQSQYTKVCPIGIRKQIKVKVKETCSALSSAFSKKHLRDNTPGLLEGVLSENQFLLRQSYLHKIKF